MNWSWFVGVMLEWGSIVVLVHGLEDRREEWALRKVIVYLVLYAAVFSGIYAGVIPESVSFVCYILLFLYIKWGYKETLERSLTVFVIGAAIINLLELVGIWAFSFFIDSRPVAGVFDILGVAFTFAGCIVLSRLKIYRVIQFLEQREFLYVMMALLSLMLFAPVTVFKIFKELNVLDYIYICICVVLMWVMAAKMQNYKMDMKYRRKYLEGYSDVIMQMRRRHHTMANQLNAVLGMIDVCHDFDELVERQRAYVGKLQNYELPTEAIVLEEPAVVALIYEKAHLGVEMGIEVATSFRCSLVGGRVSDLEWVEILGVLLENAIEALENYDIKKIWISVRERGENKIEVRVANTFKQLDQEEIEKFSKAGFSTKGEERGIGLYDVKELVHKRRGEFILNSRFEEKESIFEVLVII